MQQPFRTAKLKTLTAFNFRLPSILFSLARTAFSFREHTPQKPPSSYTPSRFHPSQSLRLCSSACFSCLPEGNYLPSLLSLNSRILFFMHSASSSSSLQPPLHLLFLIIVVLLLFSYSPSSSFFVIFLCCRSRRNGSLPSSSSLSRIAATMLILWE